MANLKLALVFSSNARATSPEVKALSAEVRALTAEGAKSVQGQAAGVTSAQALAGAMGRLKAEIDAVAATEARAKAAMAEMVSLGGAQTAQAREMQVAVAQLGASKAVLTREYNVANTAIAAEARAFADLRASLDPVFAEKQRMAALEAQLTRAVQVGAATQGEAADVMRRAKAEMAGMDAAMGRIAGSGGAAQQTMRNLAYQANQVGQMTAVSGNFLSALAIQIPDILASFGGLPMILAGGAIAMGVSFLPALLNVGDGAEEVRDKIDEAAASVDAYSAAVDRASSSDADLFADYGSAVGPARELLEVRRELALLDASTDLRASGESLIEKSGLDMSLTAAELGNQLAFIEDATRRIDAIRDARQAAEDNWVEFDESAAAKRIFDLQQQIAAYGGVEFQIEELGQSLGVGTAEAARFAQALVGIDDAAGPREQAAAMQEAMDALRQGAEAYGPLNDEARAFIDLLEQAADAALRQAAAQDRGVETVEAKISVLEHEAELQRAIATYGRDSAEVAALQRDEARAAMEAWADAQGVTAELKAELMAAWDAANGVASASGNISFAAAASSAGQLAANLGISLRAASALLAMGGGGAEVVYDPRDPRYDATAAEMGRIRESYNTVSPFDPSRNRGLQPSLGGGGGGGSGGGGGGGGASTVDREREAVEDLIASLEDEIALARETDPVRQELLRHREDLAGATAEERAQVEQLIRTRDAEAEALERLQDMQDEARDQTRSFTRDLLDAARTGESAWGAVANALDRVSDKLADMASNSLSNLLWGQQGQSGGGLLGGLLGGLFGLGGGGALPGSTSSILGITPHAMGGVPGLSDLSGQVIGRPTLFGMLGEAGDEAILPLSGGGVRAMLHGRETRLPLVRLPGGQLGVDVQPYAMGGVPGGARIASSSGGGMFGGGAEGTIRVVIEASDEFRASIVETARRVAVETVTRGLQAYDRRLPERLRGIDADPGYVG